MKDVEIIKKNDNLEKLRQGKYTVRKRVAAYCRVIIDIKDRLIVTNIKYLIIQN